MTSQELKIYRRGYSAGWMAGRRNSQPLSRPTKDTIEKQKQWAVKYALVHPELRGGAR